MAPPSSAPARREDSLNRPLTTTLSHVDVAPRHLADYRGVAPDALLDEVVALAAELRGLRVLQINATAYGGGVAELLASQVALLDDLGIDAEWHVMLAESSGSPSQSITLSRSPT